MNKVPKIPTAIKVLQVVLSALAGGLARFILTGNWILQLIAFIVAFVLIYTLIGGLYFRLTQK